MSEQERRKFAYGTTYDSPAYFIDNVGRLWFGPACPGSTLHFARASGFYSACTDRPGDIVWVCCASELPDECKPLPVLPGDDLEARLAELEGELQRTKTINRGYERWNKEAKRLLGDARQQRIDETASRIIAAAYPGSTVTPHAAYETALALEAERERRVGDDV